MRPIKFRAWDKKQNLWLSNSLNTYCVSGGIVVHVKYKPLGGGYEPESVRQLKWSEIDDLEIVQFTGLLDKYGKEIYEGDILVFGRQPHHPGNGNFKVYWHTEKPMFHVERFPKEKFMTPDLRQENCTHYEVIGNIYENPELLKPA